MILVDTSIWIDHFRESELVLQSLLRQEQVVVHPFVVGELSVGNLQPRERLLNFLYRLPSTDIVRDEEVLSFISSHALFGRGIGYIDAHLLVAAKFTPDTTLWTRDKRLREAAEELNVATNPEACVN